MTAGASASNNVFEVVSGSGTFSISASSANVTAGASLYIGSVNYLGFTSGTLLYGPTAGKVAICTQAGINDATAVAMLQFAGDTAAYPAIKRAASSTTLAFRLANDSAGCPITASDITASGFINATEIRCDGSTVLDTVGARLDVGNSGGFTSATLCNAGAGSALIQIGGTASMYGAIKGTNTGILSFRLADDSAGCSIISGMTSTTTVGHTITGLTNQSVPMLKLNMGATPTGNVLEINSNGGSGGDITRITAAGTINIPSNQKFSFGNGAMHLTADNADISLTNEGASRHIKLVTTGADGLIWFGTRTAIGAETVTGYIIIKDQGGTDRKLAVVS